MYWFSFLISAANLWYAATIFIASSDDVQKLMKILSMKKAWIELMNLKGFMSQLANQYR
jgi:hypothetical protein